MPRLIPVLLLSLFLSSFAHAADPEAELKKLKLEKQRLEMQREVEQEKAKLEQTRREMKEKADKERDKAEQELKAQEEEAEKKLINPYGLGFGAQLGFAIATADVEPAIGTTNRFTPTFGVFIEAPVLPGFLSFQPEINYVAKGGTNIHFGPSATTKLNYLEVPLLAKIKFMTPRVRPFVVGGPSMGFTLSREVEGVPAAMNQLNGFELGLILGAGFTYQISDSNNSTELVFSARYSTGITDIDTAAGAWHSRTFMLLVGAML